MPSPIPPNPPRSFWERSLKFQVIGSPLLLSGLLAVDIHISVAWLYVKAGANSAGPSLVHQTLLPVTGCQALACLRNSVRSALLQSGIALILFSFSKISACCCM